MSEITEYKGFKIKVFEEDGDWIAEISKDGDSEGYMSTEGLTKPSAIHKAKEVIDKIVKAITREAYFQGGGGVNEPTHGKKKYKSDPALVVQPRFEEPFYRNYDSYTVPGMEHVGPGTGYHGLQNYKSVAEFLEARRKRLIPRYVADDSWQLDNGKRVKTNPGIKARASIFERIIKIAGPNYDLGKGLYQEMSDGKVDSVEEFREEGNHGPAAIMNLKKNKDINHIDFPIDDQIKSSPITVENEPYGGLVGEGPYFPENDFEGKTPEQLDFGRDYTEDTGPSSLSKDDLDELANKYLNPSESELFGLPDGIDPNSDLDAVETEQVEQPYDTTSDIGTQMYTNQWSAGI
ncbi:MAG TPA: hypothetical protein VII94_02745 [Candidatus Saccharimonadales bacterium]